LIVTKEKMKGKMAGEASVLSEPPPKGASTFKGADELEKFLHHLERELLKMSFKDNEEIKTAPIDDRIRHFLDELKLSDCAVMPADKTNSIVLVKMIDCVKHVNVHLKSSAKTIARQRINEFCEDSLCFLEKIQDKLSENENNHIKSAIESKQIATPKMLTKDHKDPDKNGDYKTRLVLPARNFAAGFSNVGHRGCRKVKARPVDQKIKKRNVKHFVGSIVS